MSLYSTSDSTHNSRHSLCGYPTGAQPLPYMRLLHPYSPGELGLVIAA